MDQLKSNNPATTSADIPLPRRSFSMDFFVGIFVLAALACAGYLAVGLGDIRIFNQDRYVIFAEFDNVSGLKEGASVEIAGVQVGEVLNIGLADLDKTCNAKVTLSLDKSIRIRDDDIAAIRTKGIIGDRYVKISRGASNIYLPAEGTITETESVVDIEDIIGKLVHSFSGEKENGEEKKS